MVDTVAAIQQGVDAAVRRIVRRGNGVVRSNALVDIDDLRSEAVTVCLGQVSRGKFRATSGTVQQYSYVTATRAAGNYVSRTLAVPSVPASYENGRDLQSRVDYQGSVRADNGAFDRSRVDAPRRPPKALIDHLTPEATVLDRERSERARAWHRDAKTAISRTLATLTPKERTAAERLWGLDGLAPEHDRQRLARQLGVPVSVVYRVNDKVRRRVLGSQDLQRLHRQSMEIRQGSKEE